MGRSLVPDHVENYVERTIARESEVQAKLRAETSTMRGANMQISADQAAFFGVLLRAIGAQRAIEVGTYTGYSSLAIAGALPANGKLICCDISEEWTSVARRHWEMAGLSSKIELRLAPANKTLQAMIDGGERGTFDFMFIDADKTGYDTYYEQALVLLRSRGVIVLDNMLWGGAVAEKSDEADTIALQKLNLKIRDDDRVDSCLVTIGDGLVVATKR